MSYGDGTIYKYRGGFAGQFYVNGKPKHVYGKTKPETRQKLREARAAIEGGRDLAGGRETLGAYLRWWLVNLMSPPNVSSVTTVNYTFAVGILPAALTDLRLDRITPEHVEEAVAGLHEHYASNTVRTARRVLKSALQYAVNSGRIGRNPAGIGRGVGITYPDRQLPAWDDLLAFVEGTRGDRWHALWVLLCYTGMRIGEALALEWGDVEGDTLHIRRSVHYDGLNRWIGATKTPTSVRSLHVAPEIREALVLRKIQAAQEQLRAQTWEASTRIYSQRDGRIQLSSGANDALRRACIAADFPCISPHTFRHAYATHGAELGIHPTIMQRILGHSDIAVTLRYYTHLGAPLERIKVPFEDPGVALYWDEQEERAYWCDPEIADILPVKALSQETLSNALTHLAREIARSKDGYATREGHDAMDWSGACPIVWKARHD